MENKWLLKQGCPKNSTIYDKATEDRKKSVQNLSSTPLTKDQESLLSHGPKFVITPKQTPVGEYITAVEQTCTKLNQAEQEELRVEVKRALKKAQRSPANISKEEYKADYIEKAEELLKHNNI